MLWIQAVLPLRRCPWLDGDPAQPHPPEGAAGVTGIGGTDNTDMIAMPDTWEYPWYASWDLAFHWVALAHPDPGVAKHQLTMMCREWYMHPNGQLPAYEWNFDDVNPPVLAWAALGSFESTAGPTSCSSRACCTTDDQLHLVGEP